MSKPHQVFYALFVDAEEAARKVLKLVDALEDLDDVQNIWFNADIPDAVMEAVEA